MIDNIEYTKVPYFSESIDFYTNFTRLIISEDEDEKNWNIFDETKDKSNKDDSPNITFFYSNKLNVNELSYVDLKNVLKINKSFDLPDYQITEETLSDTGDHSKEDLTCSFKKFEEKMNSCNLNSEEIQNQIKINSINPNEFMKSFENESKNIIYDEKNDFSSYENIPLISVITETKIEEDKTPISLLNNFNFSIFNFNYSLDSPISFFEKSKDEQIFKEDLNILLKSQHLKCPKIIPFLISKKLKTEKLQEIHFNEMKGTLLKKKTKRTKNTKKIKPCFENFKEIHSSYTTTDEIQENEEKRRKYKDDSMHKKIQSHYFKHLIYKLNDQLKVLEILDFKFETFNQKKIVSIVKVDTVKSFLNSTIKDMIISTLNNVNDHYAKNINELEKNSIIFKNLLNMKVYDFVFFNYRGSKYHEEKLKEIINTESLEYFEKYCRLDQNFIYYFFTNKSNKKQQKIGK